MSTGSLREWCILGKMVRWSCHIGEEGNHIPKIMNKKKKSSSVDIAPDKVVYDAFANLLKRCGEKKKSISVIKKSKSHVM